MKLRFSTDRASGATTLVAKIEGTDWVDHMNAQWLGTHTTPVLLRARYELDHQTTRMYFNTAGYVALPKYLKHHAIERDTYAHFLASMSQVLDITQQRNIATHNIVWSPRHVVVSQTTGMPAFAVIPSPVPMIPGRNVPQELLRFFLRPKRLQQTLGVAHVDKLQQLTQSDHFEPTVLRRTLLEVFGEPAALSVTISTDDHNISQPGLPTPARSTPARVQSSPKHAADTSTDTIGPASPSRHSVDSPAEETLNVLPTDSTVLAQSRQPGDDPGQQRATLIITRTADRHRVQLTASSVSIGRSKLADVHAGSNTDVSRIHAFLTIEQNQIFLTDNHSTNGTWTNQETLGAGERTYLGNGGTFWLGGEQFHVSMEHHPHERT